jgi:LysR family glycine cleavage system transcriptional activator
MSSALPLASLRAFEAAARHANVTRAAAELNVTQSAVSHQIRGLERHLGVALFRRTGSGLALTESGRKLADVARDSFRRLDAGLAEIRGTKAATRVTVALRPYFAVKWLAPRLARFWQAAPGVELRLIHTTAAADFAADEIDVAIEWRAAPRVDADCAVLMQCDLVPIVSPRLIGRRNLRHPDDLARFTILHEEDRSNWRRWCQLAGIAPESGAQHLIVDDTNVRLQAAIDGQGVALGCPELVTDDVRAKRLAIPFPLRLARYAYYLVTPTNHPLNEAAARFRDWARAEADGTGSGNSRLNRSGRSAKSTP